ncbi:hypothetical protein NKG05_14220 [Oerskovia sp. M15]
MRVGALLLVPALALVLTACSDDPPSAEDAAKRLATAISGETSRGRFHEGHHRCRRSPRRGPRAARRGRAHGHVEERGRRGRGEESGKQATATLTYTWDLTEATPGRTRRPSTSRSRTRRRARTVRRGGPWPGRRTSSSGPRRRRSPGRHAGPRRAGADPGRGRHTRRRATARPPDRRRQDEPRPGPPGRGRARGRRCGRRRRRGVRAEGRGAGDKAFVEAIVVRQDDTAGIDVEAARTIDGASVLDGELDLAPTRTFARAILGRVGDATAESVEESEGRSSRGHGRTLRAPAAVRRPAPREPRHHGEHRRRRQRGRGHG